MSYRLKGQVFHGTGRKGDGRAGGGSRQSMLRPAEFGTKVRAG